MVYTAIDRKILFTSYLIKLVHVHVHHRARSIYIALVAIYGNVMEHHAFIHSARGARDDAHMVTKKRSKQWDGILKWHNSNSFDPDRHSMLQIAKSSHKNILCNATASE